MEVLSLLLLLCLCLQVESYINLVSKQSHIYKNQPVSTTCTTTGSQALIWESEEYIGPGRHVSVSLSDSPGSTIPLPDSEVTILVKRTSNTPGEEMIESSLTINVTATYSNFTITCRNNDSGLTESVTYHITNEPGTELVVADQRVCPGERINIKCIAKDTILTQLNTNIATDPINCTHNDAPSQKLTVNGVPFVLDKYYSINTDGTTTLTCNVTINVDDLPNSIIGQNLSISCNNHDLAIRVNETVKIANDCANIMTTDDDKTTLNPEDITENHASIPSTSIVVNIISLGLIRLLLDC